jgi:hypothetical protein
VGRLYHVTFPERDLLERFFVEEYGLIHW